MMKKRGVFEVLAQLRVTKCDVFDVFVLSFSKGAQRAPKIDFGRVWAGLEGVLGSLFGHVGGLWSFLGSVWVQKLGSIVHGRISKAILAQVEVPGGGRKLPGVHV